MKFKGRKWSSSKKATYRGITFDSTAEMEYYKILLELKKEGKITHIERQKRFPLIDMKGGNRFFYTVDFIVTDSKGRKHCLEVKGRFMPGNKMRYAYWQQLYHMTLHIIPTTGVAKFNTAWLDCKTCPKKVPDKPVIKIYKP